MIKIGRVMIWRASNFFSSIEQKTCNRTILRFVYVTSFLITILLLLPTKIDSYVIHFGEAVRSHKIAQ